MSRRQSQETSQLAQCLLFVQHGHADSAGVSCDRRWKGKAVVLLPSAIAEKNPKISELFKRCNISLLSDKKCPILQSALERDEVEVIELILLNKGEASDSKSRTSSFQFFVDANNENVVRRIFGRNAIISVMQLNCGRFLNAVDEEHKNVVDHILRIRPHIRLRESQNSTLLHLAVTRDDKILVRMLLEHGVNADVSNDEGITPLHLATQYENLQVVKLLVDQGASVNARQKNGATCLYLAAESECLEIFKFFLSCGVSVSIGKCDGTMPLHAAAKIGSVEILKDLLMRGVDINARIVQGHLEGCTPLYFAAEEGHTAIVQCLLEHGADVNAVNHEGRSALHAALNKKCAETVGCILSYCPNLDCQNSMKEVAWLDELMLDREKFDDIIKLLLQRGFSVHSLSTESGKLLMRSISDNDIDVVRMLLTIGANVNKVCPPIWYCRGKISSRLVRYPETSPLHAAVALSRDDIVQLLLKHGADVNRKCRKKRTEITPLDIAVETSNLKLVNMLVSNGAIVQSSLIDEAFIKSDLDIIKKLLSSVDLPAEALNSRLLSAASEGNLEMVKVLLSFGADVNRSVPRKYQLLTPLQVAAGKSHLEVVKLLLTNGAVVTSDAITEASGDLEIVKTLLPSTVDIPLEMLNSALLGAASKGNLDVVKMTLSFGANVNYSALDEYYQSITPLDIAVSKDHLEVVKFLLTNGAVVKSNTIVKASSNVEITKLLLPNAVDVPAETFNTQLHYATSEGNLEMVKVLLKFGVATDVKFTADESFPVHYAAESGCDMMKLLIANNANLEIGKKSGITPLLVAATNSSSAVFDLLLIFVTCMNIFDSCEISALFHTIVHFQGNMFEAVLDALFEAPEFIVNTHFWKIFNEPYLRDNFNYYFSHDEPYFKRLSKIVDRHLIKVKAANLHVNDEEVILSWRLSDANDFRSDCECEIACMKTLTIGDSYVTFYDILMKDVKQLASYVRNDTIHQMLKSEDYKTRFPIYASIIDLQVKKGTQRRELLDEGLKICRHLFKKFLSLPRELRERIVSYLTNQNLLVLKYAFTGSV